MLQIRLFGSLELARDDEPLPVPSSEKVRSLLAYLILHHDRTISRDRLAGLFWPERSDSRARRALSQALWRIRSALDPIAERLEADRDSVALTLRPGDRLDVEEFEEWVGKWAGGKGQVDPSTSLAELSGAISLYRGDFLPDVYDDWVLLERERLRELYLGALERLITLHKQAGDCERALAEAQRLVAADPLREAGHRELMRLYHLLGRGRAALEQFAALHDLLAEELGVEPSAATSALYHEIAAALEEAESPHLPIPPPPPPLLRDLAHLPFVGRTGERARLIEALQAALRGHGAVALVEGDAGVGKTRLVQEAIAGARWRGFQVGVGKADPLVAASPYQILRDALTPLLTPLRVAQLAELVEPLWLSAVAPLLPPLAGQLPGQRALPALDPQEEQRRLWEGLGRCLEGLAAAAPLALVLEDLHWADEATLTAIPHLAPRFSSGRALLLVSYRPAEARRRAIVWETLEGLDRALPVLRVALASFARAEGVALVRRALGVGEGDARANGFARRLQDEIGSNALFLVETLKSLLERGDLAPVAGSASGGWRFPDEELPLSTPTSVQELVGERVGRLPAGLRGVLERVAVLGECTDFPVLARTGDEGSGALLSALEELGRRGFLHETPDRYCFEHDAIQEMIYRAIDPERRRAFHREAGAALEAVHPHRVEALAYHFLRGELWEGAVEYNRRAGDDARAVYANAEATTYYTRTLEALEQLPGPPDPSLRFELHLAREAVYALQGERAKQVEELDALETLVTLVEGQSSAEQQARVALRRARYSEETGDYAAAIAAAEAAISLAQSVGAVELAGEAFLGWGRGLWRQGKYQAARAQLEEALARAQDPALRRLKADVLNNLGNVSLYQGNYAQAKTYFEQTLSLNRALNNRQGEANALYNLGYVVHDLGDLTAACSYYQQALDCYREIGFRRGEGSALMIYGIALQDRGDYVSARCHYEQSLRILRNIGCRQEEALALANIGTILMLLGKYDAVQTYFDQTLSIHREAGDRRGQAVTLNSLSLFFFLLGDNRAAEEHARQALSILRELGDRYYQGQALTYLGHALEGLGQLDAAAEAYGQALEIRRDLSEPNLATEPMAGLIRVSLAQGDLPQARAHTERILDHLQGGGSLDGTYEPVRVYLSCYRALRALHDPRAGEVLETAHALLQERAAGIDIDIDNEEMRRSFLENVTAHRETVAAYREWQIRRRGQQTTVRLPHVDAPTGRPLREEEYVEVTWTVAAPEDDQIPGRVARRRHRILRLLREAAEQSAAPTLEDLAETLDVGLSTIKRDLAALRKAGHECATRGSRR